MGEVGGRKKGRRVQAHKGIPIVGLGKTLNEAQFGKRKGRRRRGKGKSQKKI